MKASQLTIEDGRHVQRFRCVSRIRGGADVSPAESAVCRQVLQQGCIHVVAAGYEVDVVTSCQATQQGQLSPQSCSGL